MSDTIRLTFPADSRFRSVATLVLGGIGSRLNLPYERTDDLQLALLSALEACDGSQALSVEVEAGDDEVTVSVGPLRPESSSDTALTRVLDGLVDSVDWATGDGADRVLLRFTRAGVDGV